MYLADFESNIVGIFFFFFACARYWEVVGVTLERCLNMKKGLCAVVLPRLAIQAPLSRTAL